MYVVYQTNASDIFSFLYNPVVHHRLNPNVCSTSLSRPWRVMNSVKVLIVLCIF